MRYYRWRYFYLLRAILTGWVFSIFPPLLLFCGHHGFTPIVTSCVDFVLIFWLIPSFFLVVFIGAPAHLILQEWGKVKYWQYALTGILIGTCIGAILLTAGWGFYFFLFSIAAAFSSAIGFRFGWSTVRLN